MISSLTKSISFDEFIDWYPEFAETGYELHNGVIIEMPKSRGKHSKIAGFIAGCLFTEITRLGLDYFIPKECVIKADENTGYEPDVIVLDEELVALEPRWEKESIITKGHSAKLAIEVVSTNWRDDYLTKLRDYEALGIPEYWIVDFLALGAKRYTGSPKQPTITIYSLIEGEYQDALFRDDEPIRSPTFPELSLTANQIFAA